MTSRQLITLIRDGEGPALEFKQAEIKPSDLAETFVAMANTRGGMVLLGVNDAGTLVGVPSLTAARDLVAAAARECSYPPLTVKQTEVRLARGGVIVVAQVPRAKGAVSTASGRFLIREGSRNVPAVGSDVARLLTVPIDAGPGAHPYEILRHDLVLELHDTRGQHATLQRTARIRFLRDQVHAVRDRIWGDGAPSPIASVAPGMVVDAFQEGSALHSLISLREPMNRGEVVTLSVVHVLRGWFTKRKEYFEVEIDLPTSELRMEIRFPEGRSPSKIWLIEQKAGRRRPLTGSNLKPTAHGSWVIWRKRKPPVGERLRTEWDW
jgi:hypothetical protein